MLIRTRLRAGFTVAAVAGLALLGTATSALACTSGDDRANPSQGTNVSDCRDAKGVSGTKLAESDLKFTGGKGEKSLTITQTAEGVTVQAIVVVGGDDGHSVYLPGKKGLSKTAPWADLIAPRNFDRSQPKIDHWFACGVKTAPSTTPTSSSAPTSAPASHTPTSAPSTPTSSAATTAAPVATTSAPAAAAPAGNNGSGGGLANTGFDNAWLFWVAGGLLVIGGGLLALLKLRRRSTN